MYSIARGPVVVRVISGLKNGRLYRGIGVGKQPKSSPKAAQKQPKSSPKAAQKQPEMQPEMQPEKQPEKQTSVDGWACYFIIGERFEQ
jgi:hypothetical protein